MVAFMLKPPMQQVRGESCRIGCEMLVPRFSISQDEKEVQVQIRLPFVRVGESEVHVDGCRLSFYCKPYLLKLQFPHELCDAEDEAHCRAVYDANKENGTMTLHLRKKKQGLHFEDLDMTTRLLQPMNSVPEAFRKTGTVPIEPPAIEVLKSESFIANADDAEEGTSGPSSTARATEGAGAALGEDVGPLTAIIKPRYGFNQQYSGVFGNLREEMLEVIHVQDPDNVPDSQYEKMRVEREAKDFEGDRYLGDLMEGDDDMIYTEAMRFEAFWELAPAKQENGTLELSDGERDELQSLRNREFLIEDQGGVLLGMVDLLLATAYDHRTTQGEPTVESSWTVTTLSPSLCWLQSYRSSRHSVKDVVVAFVRRALTYPYLRRWDLARRVLRDVVLILQGGKRHILRCLLKARAILRRTESHYLLNRLFLDDYCVFVQQAGDDVLADLAKDYREAAAGLKKEDVGLDLPRWEAMATQGGREGSQEGAQEEEESADEGTTESESESDSDAETTSSSEEYSSTTDEGEDEDEEVGEEKEKVQSGASGNALTEQLRELSLEPPAQPQSQHSDGEPDRPLPSPAAQSEAPTPPASVKSPPPPPEEGSVPERLEAKQEPRRQLLSGEPQGRGLGSVLMRAQQSRLASGGVGEGLPTLPGLPGLPGDSREKEKRRPLIQELS